jgi:hypothetical protein
MNNNLVNVKTIFNLQSEFIMSSDIRALPNIYRGEEAKKKAIEIAKQNPDGKIYTDTTLRLKEFINKNINKIIGVYNNIIILSNDEQDHERKISDFIKSLEYICQTSTGRPMIEKAQAESYPLLIIVGSSVKNQFTAAEDSSIEHIINSQSQSESLQTSHETSNLNMVARDFDIIHWNYDTALRFPRPNADNNTETVVILTPVRMLLHELYHRTQFIERRNDQIKDESLQYASEEEYRKFYPFGYVNFQQVVQEDKYNHILNKESNGVPDLEDEAAFFEDCFALETGLEPRIGYNNMSDILEKDFIVQLKVSNPITFPPEYATFRDIERDMR